MDIKKQPKRPLNNKQKGFRAILAAGILLLLISSIQFGIKISFILTSIACIIGMIVYAITRFITYDDEGI